MEVWQQLGWEGYGALLVTFGVLVTLAAGRVPPDFVLLGALAVLLVSGILDIPQALSGFSAPGMITVGALYIVVAGVQETGGLAWISRRVLGWPRSRLGAQLRLLLPVTGLSAFLNNTPVVALFIPAVTRWADRIGDSPSRLLIPLSYASILGGLCTLIGTSTNLVVNDLYQQRAGVPALGFFEITRLGLPCALVGLAYLLLAGRRLLPDRKAASTTFADTRAYTVEMLVSEPGRGVAGLTVEKAGLRHLPGGFLAEIRRRDRVIAPVEPTEVLEAGDRLVFVGAVPSILELRSHAGLQLAEDQVFRLDAPRREHCLVEVVVAHTCPLVGRSIREGDFRRRYNAVVIAAARNGARVEGRLGDVVLRPGDVLLVEAHAGFVPRQRDAGDFYLVSGVEDSAPLQHEKAPLAALIVGGMVVAVSFRWLSMLPAALLAAALMLVFRCCSYSRARRSIEWNVLLVIAAAIGIGAALDHSGAARAVADTLLRVGGGHPLAALAVIYLTTTLFTELITNNAAAVLVFPIAMETASRLDVSPLPFIFCIMVGASASFATPIGYQTNLMVYGPGGYRYTDYLRIGLPLNLLIGVVCLLLAPWLWPF